MQQVQTSWSDRNVWPTRGESAQRTPRDATKKGRICSLTTSHLQEATTTKGEKKQNAHECKKSTLLEITIQRFKRDQDKE